MRTFFLLLLSAFVVIVLFSCTDESGTSGYGELSTSEFHFPTDSNTLYQWIADNQSDSLARHTWQVWNMINQPSDQVKQETVLRDWMTWPAPNQVVAGLQASHQRLIDLDKPRQFHAKALSELDPAFYVSVQYNEGAASFSDAQGYLKDSVLQQLLDANRTSIKEFPDSSIAIKPVFYVISQDDEYGRIPVWDGPPADPWPYPSDAWNNYIYVDLNNTSESSQMTCDSTQSDWKSKCTYNVDDFIYYRLTAEEVELVEQEGNQNIRAGDYAVLVGMHMTTKEIRRWTWQTFFWTPDPDNPPFPSSVDVATQGSFIKDPAVRHYATTIAYQMIIPSQPYSGGDIDGQPVYAFNPYLEAPFDFGPDQAIRLPGFIQTPVELLENKYGIQSNCMSCHALSHYFKTDTVDNDFYVANTYVDMDKGKVITSMTEGMQDSIEVFVGKLKTDFLWSIPDIANNDQN